MIFILFPRGWKVSQNVPLKNTISGTSPPPREIHRGKGGGGGGRSGTRRWHNPPLLIIINEPDEYSTD